ncbi:MAG: flavin reductase family protein [Ruminococcaceae bacterium]|nr:flavin reductase family protein [Oscillospiraceae bacterium]
MKNFSEISLGELDGAFDLIGKDWMLITAKGKNAAGEEIVNTMTASWGCLGFLWKRPVAFIFVRPQRYTYMLTEQTTQITLSFFEEKYREALRFCGTKSGRDVDKFAATGLSVDFEDGAPVIPEARMNVLCRKIYTDILKKEGFLEKDLLKNYPTDDFHRVYVVEIEKVLKREEA